MAYLLMKFGLVAALTAAYIITIASGFPSLALGVSAAITALICYLIHIYRRDFPAIYQAREKRVLERFPTGRIFGVIVFSPISVAPIVIVVGLCLVAGSYYALLDPTPPSRFLIRLLFDTFGPVGPSALLCFLGIVLVVNGAETIIGHRLRTRPA